MRGGGGEEGRKAAFGVGAEGGGERDGLQGGGGGVHAFRRSWAWRWRWGEERNGRKGGTYL